MGCSLASGLVDLIKKIKRNVDPDLLFIEPSEMVVTRELKDVTAMGLRDVRFGAGPFITLVDGAQFPFLWSDRRALLLGQVKDSDLVAVSRMDLIGSRDMETINGLLQGLCGPLIPLSAQNGDGMGEVMKRID